MTTTVKKHGNYDLFETTHHHKILKLDNDEYFAWVETNQGEILVLSDSDHKKSKSLSNGEYILFTPRNEPDMNDNIDHLELQEGDHFRNYVLPQGLPSERDIRNKIIKSDIVDKEKIHRILNNQ